MKARTEITFAINAENAALKSMKGSWNNATKELITKSVMHTAHSIKTDVYTAEWSKATKYMEAGIITAYVQVYDEALDLYQVTVQY